MIEIKHRTTGAIIRTVDGASLRWADLGGANLCEADLCGANLCGANLRGAYLREADLREADLRDAYLGGADLCGANLRGAYLREADLREADLRGADLRGAYLGGADLHGAYLRGANLCEASLRWADLGGANLCGANLCGTILEPETSLPSISDAELIAAGLEEHGGYVHGWRTAVSQHVGSATYEPGHIYVAPWFSVDASSACHPGIYIAGRSWLDHEYPGANLVRVRCQRADLLHAGDKWRARAIEVLP